MKHNYDEQIEALLNDDYDEFSELIDYDSNIGDILSTH